MLHLPTHSAGGSIHFHEFLSAQNKNKSGSFFLHPINPNYPYSKVNIMIYLRFCELAIPFSLNLLNISQREFGVNYLSCIFILYYDRRQNPGMVAAIHTCQCQSIGLDVWHIHDFFFFVKREVWVANNCIIR